MHDSVDRLALLLVQLSESGLDLLLQIRNAISDLADIVERSASRLGDNSATTLVGQHHYPAFPHKIVKPRAVPGAHRVSVIGVLVKGLIVITEPKQLA